VLAVESICSLHGTDKGESEIRNFLSSCRDDPAILGAAIRAHWSIENAVYWVLDAPSGKATAGCASARRHVIWP
jgi:predicted transposase YbfD/YdcC